MKEIKHVAVVGASGAVGQEFLRIMESHPFFPETLRLFGSARSTGHKYTFRGKDIVVEELRKDPELFRSIDIAFCSAGSEVSRNFAETITKYGCLMIDNSNAFRMDEDVPLVVPEVNAKDALEHPRNIIANPNCTTIQLVVALNAIERLSHIRRVHVATYQAASGAGSSGIEELLAQHRQLVQGEEVSIKTFSARLAYNLIPQVDIFLDNDYTREEMKMYYETRKIMHSDIAVSATCVRVPVERAHSEAVWVETETPLAPKDVRIAFASAPGLVLVDDPEHQKYPMPLNAALQEPVYVGRVRKDLTNPNGISFWCVGDQIMKGAALNAIQIAEWLTKQ